MTDQQFTARDTLRLCPGDQDLLVREGSLRVFLQPVQTGRPLRQSFLGTAMQGDVVPAPPPEKDGRFWTLICLPLGEVHLSRMPSPHFSGTVEEYLQGSVFRLAGEFGNLEPAVEKEKFWEIISDRWASQEESQRDRIRSKATRRSSMRLDTARRMQNSFHSRLDYEIASSESSGSPLYDALAFLCRRRSVPIAPLPRVRRACSGEPGIQDIARVSGFACRAVLLKEDWKRRVYEPFLVLLSGKDGEHTRPVVCFRNRGLLQLYDAAERSFHRLTREEAEQLTGEAWTLLRPFGSEPVDLKKVLQFCIGEVSPVDIALLLGTMFLVTEVGLALSSLNRFIFDQAIPQSDASQAYALGVLCLLGIVSSLLFSISQNLTRSRLYARLTHSLQAAVYDRTLHMPEHFFRGQESAAMAYRIFHLAGMYVSVIQSSVNIVLQLAFSLFYVQRMFSLSPRLSGIGLAMACAMMALTVVRSILARKLSIRRMNRVVSNRSLLYQSFSGIPTIRAAGAEDQLLYRYMESQTEMGRIRARSDRLSRLSAVAFSLISGAGMILLYGAMGSGGGLTLGIFMAFLTANSFFSSAVQSAAADGVSLGQMVPMLRDATGVLKEIPEKSFSGQIPKQLSGDLVLSHVSFGYDRGGARILKDISLHIRPGEYVGIAGHSGSGKSTLIRLLLGFSAPDMGQIYYDGVPIGSLNRTELRRRIGSVLQDGSLISGSILQNIRISRPDASVDEVWHVLELAAIRQEIEQMPMGLMTHVSEESLTLSGGQKQRLLLARALLGNPRMLILDEATSALDNLTQETVIRNLASLDITRIAVAHRLSTLQSCDRILVMEQGMIVEEGSYESLMERKGRFHEMVRTQQNAEI